MSDDNEQKYHPLSDEQAAIVGRELARHLRAGAEISCDTGRCLESVEDGTIYGGLTIKYRFPIDINYVQKDKYHPLIVLFVWVGGAAIGIAAWLALGKWLHSWSFFA